MRFSTKLLLGGVLSLVLGFALASFTLFSSVAPGPKVQIRVDVVYAYFAVQNFNRNVLGLWRNLSDPVERNFPLLSYFIVLNVTNLSDNPAYIDQFQASSAQEIFVHNGTTGLGSQELGRSVRVNQTSSSDNRTGGYFGLAEMNVIVMDVRDFSKGGFGFNALWSASESRLIALTGIREVSNSAAFAALQNGTVYLFGKAEGRAFSGGSSYSFGFDLRFVHLQISDGGFLFNMLVSENQLLRMDSSGVEVFVETRR